MSIISETTDARTYEEILPGEVYTIDSDHLFWRDLSDEKVRPLSEFSDEIIAEVRAAVETDTVATIYRLDIFDANGRQLEVPEKQQHYEAWKEALAVIDQGKLKFQSHPNTAVRVGELTFVNRGSYYADKLEVIDGVETVTFISSALWFEREEAAYEALKEEFLVLHDPTIAAHKPAWNGGNADVDVEYDGSGSVTWGRDVVENELVAVTMSRFDNIESGTYVEGAVEFRAWFGTRDAVEFTSTDHMREAADKMLLAAEEIDNILNSHPVVLVRGTDLDGKPEVDRETTVSSQVADDAQSSVQGGADDA